MIEEKWVKLLMFHVNSSFGMANSYFLLNMHTSFEVRTASSVLITGEASSKFNKESNGSMA